jgi:pimeloyl-ACP methyl ester carboxylesterase
MPHAQTSVSRPCRRLFVPTALAVIALAVAAFEQAATAATRPAATARATAATRTTAASPRPRSIREVPIRTVRAGDGRIGYRSFGRGRPLVLIMGLGGTMDAWAPSVVNALARHRRVITFDNLGIRRTTLKGPITIPRMARTVASLVRALRLRRADVLGWSMGGMIAQSLARLYPQRVRRLVLCATAPGDGKATPPKPGTQFGTALFPPNRGDLMAAWSREITSYPNAQPGAPANIFQQQLAAIARWIAGRERSGRELRKIRLPVLVAHGALDRLLPVANARHIAHTIRGARLVVYRDAAHNFLFQHRRDFVARVNAFLR